MAHGLKGKNKTTANKQIQNSPGQLECSFFGIKSCVKPRKKLRSTYYTFRLNRFPLGAHALQIILLNGTGLVDKW